ncbi:MAG: hypothetical protein J0I65_19565 [Variovorax sp.]|nr:hypothetical protein [Variovorax sp.]|tara:strand:- start:321 stop:635 length:315 start_codon:yes stop_codon:yes gene_type:complete
MTFAVVALATLGLLGGCSSDESRIYDAFKCGHVARILGRTEQARAAADKVKPLLDKKTGNPGPYMMKLRDKMTDDLELHRLSPQGQSEKIIGIYESGTCQKLYE